MRVKGHAKLGFMAGAAVAAVPYVVTKVAPLMDRTKPLIWIPIARAAAVIAAALPDMIESAKQRGPNHRALFHSWVVLIGITVTGYMIYRERIPLDQNTSWGLVLPAIAGYASHLVADSFTSKGLPFS